MKTIIAGTRDITNPKHLEKALKQAAELMGIHVDELICGMSGGVDMMAYHWAKSSKLPIKPFPPDWTAYGKAAGPIRNQKMAEYGNALIAIRVQDGKSDGTDDMIERAKACGLKIFVYKV